MAGFFNAFDYNVRTQTEVVMSTPFCHVYNNKLYVIWIQDNTQFWLGSMNLDSSGWTMKHIFNVADLGSTNLIQTPPFIINPYDNMLYCAHIQFTDSVNRPPRVVSVHKCDLNGNNHAYLGYIDFGTITARQFCYGVHQDKLYFFIQPWAISEAGSVMVLSTDGLSQTTSLQTLLVNVLYGNPIFFYNNRMYNLDRRANTSYASLSSVALSNSDAGGADVVDLDSIRYFTYSPTPDGLVYMMSTSWTNYKALRFDVYNIALNSNTHILTFSSTDYDITDGFAVEYYGGYLYFVCCKNVNSASRLWAGVIDVANKTLLSFVEMFPTLPFTQLADIKSFAVMDDGGDDLALSAFRSVDPRDGIGWYEIFTGFSVTIPIPLLLAQQQNADIKLNWSY